MIRYLSAASAALALMILAADAPGRGFGGGGGGGFHGGGGGFGGGGFGGGDFHAGGGFGGGVGGGFDHGFGGGFNAGAFGGGARPAGYGGYGGYGGGLDAYRGGGAAGFAGADRGFGGAYGAGAAGGFRNDALGPTAAMGGAYRGGEFGNAFAGGGATRSQLSSFLGLPSDAGMHSVTSSNTYRGVTVDRGAVEGPRGGEAAGAVVQGPRGGEAARGAAVGPNGGAVAGRGAVGPGGAGVAQGAAVGPRGAVAGGTVARGPDGGVAARGYAAGFDRVAPSARYATAAAVRRGFDGWGLYRPDWYRLHPGAWYAADMVASAWEACTWDSLDTWLALSMAPDYYDYGSNVVYQDNNVYVDGEDAGTGEEYYQQASTLAATGAAAQPASDDQWLPLGVFAMTHGDKASANLVLQLAVDKQGIIRGNYTDSANNDVQPVQGSVDRKTQRASWTIGKNAQNVLETGIYNLTKDEAPVLVHFGKDRTEQWLLVRLKQNDTAAAGPGADGAAAPDATTSN